jgi:hypothetical protein
MEDLTLPSVGACFKKWGCCTSILPKCQEVLQNSPQKKIKKIKIRRLDGTRGLRRGRQATSGRPLAAAWAPFVIQLLHLFLPSAPIFFSFGQLLLIGFSTCPPWLDLAQRLQTLITFDP